MTVAAKNGQAASVLVVDDTQLNLDLLTKILKSGGYRPRAAISGAAALASVRQDPPDLILLDVNMSDMDGYEVCRLLKADEKYRDIPVIFLSALNETMDKVKAFEAGGQDYITKPFELEEVYARVETHLTLRAAREFLKEKNTFLEYAFSRFVAPEVVETMKSRPISEFLRMERCEITILFADLRGFTALADRATPEQVQETLNSVLEVMVKNISAAGGMVDKYLGDGLMALFGAPFRQEDHAWRALKAASEMQLAHASWMKAREAAGKLSIPMGIGLASGNVVAGAYGTRNRMEYTALGKAVNIASRLCDAAGEGEILAASGTIEEARLKAPVSAFADSIFNTCSAVRLLTLKNIKEPVEVVKVGQAGL